MYERKQNSEDFFSLLAVTYSRFGNCTANGLVTEQPQYSVVVCIFPIWQNTEISLISNGLRFIYAYSLLLAWAITFHCFRHTYATLQLAAGTDLYTISKMLTHSTVATTQVYADVVNDLKRKASEQITLK